MSRLNPQTAVPCGVCAERIQRWLREDNPIAEPCGHTLDEIHAEIARATARRVTFGQHTTTTVTAPGGHP